MFLPIIGIIIIFAVFMLCNFVAWTLLLLQITPEWTIWVAGIVNFVFGCVAMSLIQWLKEIIEDRRYEKLFEEEEND